MTLAPGNGSFDLVEDRTREDLLGHRRDDRRDLESGCSVGDQRRVVPQAYGVDRLRRKAICDWKSIRMSVWSLGLRRSSPGTGCLGR
jgi:hypothetical protein